MACKRLRIAANRHRQKRNNRSAIQRSTARHSRMAVREARATLASADAKLHQRVCHRKSLMSNPSRRDRISLRALVTYVARTLAFLVAFGAAPLARGDFATFVIDQLYSNADGTVQYIVLREAQGINDGSLLAGRTLTSTHAGVTKVFSFPADLPS